MKCKHSSFILSVLCIICAFFYTKSYSQDLKCQVRVIETKLPQEKRQEVKDLDKKIQNYVENFNWIINEKSKETINVAIQVYLENIVFTFENQFTANMVFFASDGSYYGDKYCVFPYSQSDMLEHQSFQFVPLTGLIDYFIYMLLGHEFDKVTLYGGTPYFKKAREIANSGNYSRYNKWWDRRLNKVDNILKESHNSFREIVYNFEQSYNYFTQKENEIAIEFLLITLDSITELINNTSEEENIDQFFERNHKRLAEVANIDKDRTFLTMIKDLDTRRADFYDNYK